MTPAPRAYRRLLRTYPLEWRERCGDAVLAAQLDLDAARGRAAPTAADRLVFLVAGLSEHLRRPAGPTPPLSRLIVAPMRFDQTNGVVEEGTDALDRRGMRIDRHHGRGGLDAAGNAPDGLMQPIGL